jgi:cysteine synthase B
MNWNTIDHVIGDTPLVRLQRLPTGSNTLLLKLEGQNPAGSVKDRPALRMITEAEARGDITPGDTLIEATSGNTGIALAMVAAIRGYRMVLVMPESASLERRASMLAYGAELVLTSAEAGMEGARDRADALVADGKGRVLDQFGNPDNPLAHYGTTGPEIWRQTEGRVTHFVASMGTTGTIMGVGRYLHEQNPDVKIIGVQPDQDSDIPGIRRWPEAYLPTIFDAGVLDGTVEVSRQQSDVMARRLACEEGIACGISSGGNVAAALNVLAELNNAIVVTIACDRGDRYLSTGLYDR